MLDRFATLHFLISEVPSCVCDYSEIFKKGTPVFHTQHEGQMCQLTRESGMIDSYFKLSAIKPCPLSPNSC